MIIVYLFACGQQTTGFEVQAEDCPEFDFDYTSNNAAELHHYRANMTLETSSGQEVFTDILNEKNTLTNTSLRICQISSLRPPHGLAIWNARSSPNK